MSPAAARGVFWAPGTTCEEQWLRVAIINTLPRWGVAEVPPAPNYVNPIICRGGFAETACSCNTFFLEMVKFSWKWLLSLKHYAPRAERGQLTRMWLGKVGLYSWPIMPLSLSLLTQTEAGGLLIHTLTGWHVWANTGGVTEPLLTTDPGGALGWFSGTGNHSAAVTGILRLNGGMAPGKLLGTLSHAAASQWPLDVLSCSVWSRAVKSKSTEMGSIM